MSDYYKYEFTSVEPIYALVQEELKSYFDTGMIDSLAFPIYVDKCLQKLGKGSYKIQPGVLHIEDFQARLPDDFYAVREAWLCTNVSKDYQLPNATYQEVSSTSIRLDNPDIYCDTCRECTFPDIIKAVYKTTNKVAFHFRKQYLLKPGVNWSKGDCREECKNFHSSGPESFDIHDNKFTVSFREGFVYLLYYTKTFDESGEQMIPDNFRIKEYIEAFLKQKMFEQVSNQVTDETYNQIQQKAQYYKQLADEAFVIAQIETKKETIYNKARKIVRTMNSLNKYRLP